MPLPFIIGGIGAAVSAIGATAATVGTAAAATAATVGTAAAATAATVGTTAAAVGTAAVAAAATPTGMAVIGGTAALAHSISKDDAEYEGYKRGVKAGEKVLEETNKAHAKEIESKNSEIEYMNKKIEKEEAYIQKQDEIIDNSLNAGNKKSITQRLSELQTIYEMSLISEEEYEKVRLQILSEI